MPNTPWKNAERNVAHALGTQRNPLSGAVPRLTASDTLHDKLYVEVKYRSSFALLTEMHKAERNAKAENKVPILALQEKYAKRRYYVISETDFITLTAATLTPTTPVAGPEQPASSSPQDSLDLPIEPKTD